MKKQNPPLNAANLKPKALVLAVKQALPYLVAFGLGTMVVSPAVGRSGDSAAAFTATQLIRQFTLKNTVTQVNQGLQGNVQEVNGVMRASGMGVTPTGYPVGMGSVPSSANLPQRDGAGRPLGYCAWDNSSSTSSGSFLAGQGVANPLLYAVVSPGLNGSMETSCAYILANRRGLGDDHVQFTGPSQAASSQFKTAVATYAELVAMTGDEGDIRLVIENNKLYSRVGGAWQPVEASSFTDDSGNNGTGAIAYTTGTVTVADFQASTALVNGALSGSTATFTGGVSANSFVGNGAALTDLNASNVSSGVLGTAFGGTGVNGSAAAAGSLLIGTGAGYALGGISAGDGISVLNGAGSITISNTGVTSIAGTANQVNVSGSTGAVTLSLPQAIATTSTPTFGGMALNGDLTGVNATFTGALGATRLNVGTTAGVSTINTIIGIDAMPGVQTGIGGNTAIGNAALYSNTSGILNVATGSGALYFNTSGSLNVATGAGSLHHNTTGYYNTATGNGALHENTTGYSNTATGLGALGANTIGFYNTATGVGALAANTTGANNTALGYFAMLSLSSGGSNTAIGQESGRNITAGSRNVLIGELAGTGATTSNNNIAIGSGAAIGNALSYAVTIGNDSSVTTSNTVVLGRTTDSTVIGATGSASSGLLQNKILQVTGDVGISGNLAIGGNFTASGFSGNGSGLTNLNAANISSGVLPVARGGTGLGTTPANGRLLIGNGSGYTLANITGTANQVNVANGAGSITLSLPQAIATTSAPTFGGMALNGGLTGTTATFSGAVSVSRLDVSTSAGGVSNPNVILGTGAMPGVQSGAGNNLVLGYQAMYSNTTGYSNVASGAGAMYRNTQGYRNTAVGVLALYNNTTGTDNVAIGVGTLTSNTTGANNVAVGQNSLLNNTTGYANVATGGLSLLQNTTGIRNVASGGAALYNNTAGFYNNAVGFYSLYTNVTGNRNSALGAYADVTVDGLSYATAIGSSTKVSTSNTVVLGRTTDTTVIGATGTASSGLLQNKILQVTGNVGISGDLVIGGNFTANSFTGDGSGLTDLNAGNISSGVLASANGGTGVNGSAAANGQLLIGNGSGYTLANITGTANQVNVANGAGSITLSLPQAIATTSSPTFGGMALNGNLNGTTGSFTGNLSAQRLILSDSSGGVTFPNVVIGANSMLGTPSGTGANTAVGIESLTANTSGHSNTALGRVSLRNNLSGSKNTATGVHALYSNTSGSDNTAIGFYALELNTSGSRNVAIGIDAGYANSSGAGNANTTGNNNTFIGSSAMPGTATQLSYATALGSNALVTTSNTIALGRTTDSTVIGATGRASSGILQNKTLQVTGGAGFIGGVFVDANNSPALTVTSIHSLGLDSVVRASAATGAGYNTTGQYALNAIYRADTDSTASANWKALAVNREGVNVANITALGAAYFAGDVAANAFTGNGSGLTDLNAGNIATGILSVENGGTGINGSAAANGQLLIGNGSGYTLANITGTANQVNVANGAGSITLSLPQAIATTSSPTFGGMLLNGHLDGNSANFSGNVSTGGNTLTVGSGTTGMTLLLNDIPGAKWRIQTPGNFLGFVNDFGGTFQEKMRLSAQGNLTVAGTVSAASFSGNGGDLTNLDASNITTGTLPVARGGTGINGSTAANGRLLIGNGSGYTLANITGTANQVNVANGAGSITLSLPQAIATTSTPTFGGMTLNGNLNGTNANLSGNALVDGKAAIGSTALDGSIYALQVTGQGGAKIQSNNGPALLVTATHSLGLSSVVQASPVPGTGYNTTGQYALNGVFRADTANADSASWKALAVNREGVNVANITALGAAYFAGDVAANAFTGNGSGLTALNAGNIATGILPAARGGTGINGSTAANGRLLIGNGSGYTLANITGTANQVNVANGAGSITLSLPQDIATTSTPNFVAMTLNHTGRAPFGGGAAKALTLDLTYAGANSNEIYFDSSIIDPTQTASVGMGGVTRDFYIWVNGSDRLNISDAGDTTVTGAFSANGGITSTTGAFSGSVTASTFAGNGSGLTNLNASNIATGTLPVARGGTGLGTTPANGRLLIGNGTGYTLANISGTANQVNVANGAGSITLSLPQAIATTSSPTFVGMTLNGSLNGTSAAFTGPVATSRLNVFTNTGVANPNIIVGFGALSGAQSGAGLNQAVGYNVLASNTTGGSNVASGANALFHNTTGSGNVATGANAMLNNTSGGYNSVYGNAGMIFNTTGSGNSAFGESTLGQNTEGANNSAMGIGALFNNTLGNLNTASGKDTLLTNTTGSNNSALGARADVVTANLSFATVVGSDGQVSTSNTVVLGRTTDTTVIGATGDDGSGNRLQVSGSVKATAFNTSSDRRLKTDIQVLGSDSLDKLSRLQAYQYRFIADSTGKMRYGVIAQELAPLFPNAVSYDASGLMAVDYGALGAIAAAGVGRLNTQLTALESTVQTQGEKLGELDTRVGKIDVRVQGLEEWKTGATNRMDTMQNAIDLNILEIAKNAVSIQTNTTAIERLDDALFTLDEKVGNNSDLLARINSRWANNFSESADGSLLTVNAVELKVSNFTAQQVRANSVYSQRLEAEMARIADLEVNNLKANSAVANRVQAEQVNTGSTQVYAGVGLPAVLFAAKSDGHYTVSTSALDGSYATATVIVNAGQAKVVSIASEGIELYAEGNQVKVIAAGKSIKASWIKMG